MISDLRLGGGAPVPGSWSGRSLSNAMVMVMSYLDRWQPKMTLKMPAWARPVLTPDSATQMTEHFGVQ